MALPTEQITRGFPHPTLTIMEDTPTTQSLRVMKKELIANAMSVHSRLGGGVNGHVALMMTDAEYLTRAGVAFDAPAHPGDLPTHAAGLTGPQITEANRRYDDNIAQHNKYVNTKNALRQQILAAVSRTYLESLEDDEFGFADVEPRAMFETLWTAHGALDADALENNRSKISSAFDIDNEPIESLYVRAITCQRLVADDEAIADTTLIRLTIKALQTTGVMEDAIDKWDDKAETDKTWVNFKTHFTGGNKKRMKKTARAAGFHGAHAATGTNPTNPNIESAAAANTTQNTATGGAGNGRSPHVLLNNGVRMYYCHTHGLGLNSGHTSPHCQKPAEGHKVEATADNMMGGNNRIYNRNANTGQRHENAGN